MTTRQRQQDKNASAMALNANRTKNWRANYLHALNIFTPDLAPRGRPVSDTKRTNRRTDRRAASSDKSYVFGLRSHLFRARRLAPQSEIVVDHVSAPIAIPTNSHSELPQVAKDKRELASHGNSNVQLLSWEEPAVMLANNWPLESAKREIPTMTQTFEDEALTNTEDDDDDIFKMEFDGDSNDVFTGHKMQPMERQTRRFQDFDDENDNITPLSASFVPPHQLVEHGCFSLGLRDEFKRKPGVHIQ